jgi:2-octaprenyl-6-methoxyphenol hydroxylase
MDESEFVEHLTEKFAGYLGKLNLVGKRFSYPLNLNLARRYTAKRMALIGDAAHGIHPIAGQGFNLGIRDVPALTNAIIKARDHGEDIGSDIVLNEYNKLRKLDNVSLLIVTDFLNRLFSNDIFVIKQLRRIGMGTVNKIPTLKRFLSKHAMGIAFND